MSTYDHIVVGAGSGGAVVAARLSEDPSVRVLLIEAGGSHKNMNVQIPAAFAKQFHTDRDWDYTTEPEPYLNNRRIYQPRGKQLGGCSSMNAMIYMRGNRHDYDAWAAGGATGWSYEDVLPYFRRSEKNERGASRYHGADGPLHIEDPRSLNPLSETIVEAMVAAGHKANDDFNGAEQEGVGPYQLTQHRGQRWTTADGYLVPAKKRTNLDVLTKVLVRKVILENGRAIGVEVERNGEVKIIRTGGEVVLCAGALNTPHLLMLSGIGPADHLRQHGVDVVVDNPHVGQHLMDHPMYLVNYETTAKGTLAEAEHPKQLAAYLAKRRGLLTSNVAEVGGFFHTRDGEAAPDLQFIAGPAYFWEHGAGVYDKPAFVVGLSLVGPKSEGEVSLGSGNPTALPKIQFNYFKEQADMDSMVAGIEVAREVSRTAPLKSRAGTEIHPGRSTSSREEVMEAIRQGVEHTYHPSCTARIGTEESGVVSPQLKVHGVDGLRVADASVFPVVTHGNTHAPTVMVGERAAEFIRSGS